MVIIVSEPLLYGCGLCSTLCVTYVRKLLRLLDWCALQFPIWREQVYNVEKGCHTDGPSLGAHFRRYFSDSASKARTSAC